jgi:hypothetical protein
MYRPFSIVHRVSIRSQVVVSHLPRIGFIARFFSSGGVNKDDDVIKLLKTLQADVSSLKGDFSTLKGDVSTLKGDVAALKLHVAIGLSAVPPEHNMSLFLQALPNIEVTLLPPTTDNPSLAARILTLPKGVHWPTIEGDSVLFERFFYSPCFEHVLNGLDPDTVAGRMTRMCLIGTPGIGSQLFLMIASRHVLG